MILIALFFQTRKLAKDLWKIKAKKDLPIFVTLRMETKIRFLNSEKECITFLP